jgi:hypothetical protein
MTMLNIDIETWRLLIRLAFVGLVVAVVWLVEQVEELRRDRPRRRRRHYPTAAPYRPPTQWLALH